MSVRTRLVEVIRDVVKDYDEDVQVIGVEDAADDQGNRLRVMVKQRRLAPLPAAVRGALRVDYVLGITHPSQDPALAEVELDDFVPSLMLDLTKGRSWFGWTTAEKVLDEGHMSYDVECYVIGGIRGEGAS